MKREEFEELSSNIANASYLLGVMSKAAIDNTAYQTLEPMRDAHYEMSYALDYMSYAVKRDADTLWELLEESMPEPDEEPKEEEDEEESPAGESAAAREPRTVEEITELASRLDDAQRTEVYGFALALSVCSGGR